MRQAISFITSPGYLSEGTSRVITDKAIFNFESVSKRIELLSIHPGNTLDDVLTTMGFEPVIKGQVSFTEPPNDEELRLIREAIIYV